MSQQQFARRPATIFNDYKYDMPKSTKPVDGARFPATWTWEIGNNGKIYFKVNDGIFGQQDANAKNKEVELSWQQRNQLLLVLKEAIDNPNFETSQVIVSKKLWNKAQNKPNDTPSVMATFTIIRTKTGEIRVNFARGTYELMFVMNDEKLSIKTKGADGQVVDNVGLASRTYTMSFINFSSKFLDQEEWSRYSREEKNKGGNGGNNNNGGGGNKYGNNNGGGNGGGGNQTKDFDDEDFDMDF